MRHIPTSGSGELAALQGFQAPNLIVFSRSRVPPIVGLEREKPAQKTPDSASTVVEGTKSELVGFSVKSSLNLARLLSSIDWAKGGTCVHVTLTYHKAWPQTREELDRDKNTLQKWFGRNVQAGIWRLEFQNRQGGLYVPHWHVLAWIGDCDREVFSSRCAAWWSSFSGNDSEYASKFTVGDQARGTWYFAMHAAKREQSPPFRVGRWWGYIRRGNFLQMQDVHGSGPLSVRESVWWSRLYRRSTGAKVRQLGQLGQGFSWFLPRGWQWEAGRWIRERIEAERENPYEFRQYRARLD